LKENPPSEAEIRQGMDYLRRGAKVRFYADENFPEIATRVLRRYRAQVVTVQQVGLRMHPDENHAAHALRNGYVLVTCDRDYLDNRKFPLIHCPALASSISEAARYQRLLRRSDALEACSERLSFMTSG
jgi:Domain of unknown function (DUF5615)